MANSRLLRLASHSPYLCGTWIARIKQFRFILNERSHGSQSVKENECEFPLNAFASSVNGRTHKNQVNLIKPYAISNIRLYDYYRCLRRPLQVICFRYFFAWQTKWLAYESNTYKPCVKHKNKTHIRYGIPFACKRTPTKQNGIMSADGFVTGVDYLVSIYFIVNRVSCMRFFFSVFRNTY